MNVSEEEQHVLDLAEKAMDEGFESLQAVNEMKSNASVNEGMTAEEKQSIIDAELDRKELEEAAAEEAKKDKIVKKVIVSSVTKPREDKEKVENEIRDKLKEKGIEVISMKTFTKNGKFDASVVEISPANLKNIWGRRLDLENCSIIEYSR